MELKWLEDFIALAATGSFSKAAAQRHVTQPAFSRRIRALEHWVGVPLVDRSSYPTQLTAAGTRFRELAANVSADLNRARSDIRAEVAGRDQSIRFAALHTLALAFFPDWWTSSIRISSATRASLVAENLHDCVEMLCSGGCDFMLCYADPRGRVSSDLSRFRSLTLGTDRLVPVAPARAGRPILFSVDTQSAIPYLRYSSGTILGKFVEEVIATAPHMLDLTTCYENSMAEALKAMVVRGAGMAWLPLTSIRVELERGELCVTGPAEWQRPMDIRLYRQVESMRADCETLWRSVTSDLTAQERDGGRQAIGGTHAARVRLNARR